MKIGKNSLWKYVVSLFIVAFNVHAQHHIDSVFVGRKLYFQYVEKDSTWIKEIDIKNSVIKERSYAKPKDLYHQKEENDWLSISYRDIKKSTDCYNDLIDKKIRLPYHYSEFEPQYRDLVFFEKDRMTQIEYAFVGLEQDTIVPDYITNYAWTTYTIEDISFAVIFSRFSGNDDKYVLSPQYYIFPSQSDRQGYFVNGVYKNTLEPDTLAVTETHDFKLDELLYSRQLMEDTDTLKVKEHYGFFTILGRELIPAKYDSLKLDEKIIRAYKNKRITLYNYSGKEITHNIRVAIPIGDKEQVIDNNNEMYFINHKGEQSDNFSYSGLVCGFTGRLLPYDLMIMPPEKSKYDDVAENYRFVRFLYSDEKQRDAKDFWNIDFFNGSFFMDTIVYHGLDKLAFNIWESPKEWERVELDIRNISNEYKDIKLVNNETSFNRSDFEENLNSNWIIAKKEGKYGVFDATYGGWKGSEDEIVLPFEYHKITGLTSLLLLEKKGLKCYYPINDYPRYKILKPFNQNFARFKLPKGKWGWLSKAGIEYLDE